MRFKIKCMKCENIYNYCTHSRNNDWLKSFKKNDPHPSSLIDSNVNLRWNIENVRSWGMLFGSRHFEGRGACWSFEMGLGRMTSNHSLTWTCTNQTTSWLMHSRNTLVLGRAMGKFGFTRLTMVRTWGKPPSSPL